MDNIQTIVSVCPWTLFSFKSYLPNKGLSFGLHQRSEEHQGDHSLTKYPKLVLKASLNLLKCADNSTNTKNNQDKIRKTKRIPKIQENKQEKKRSRDPKNLTLQTIMCFVFDPPLIKKKSKILLYKVFFL